MTFRCAKNSQLLGRTLHTQPSNSREREDRLSRERLLWQVREQDPLLVDFGVSYSLLIHSFIDSFNKSAMCSSDDKCDRRARCKRRQRSLSPSSGEGLTFFLASRTFFEVSNVLVVSVTKILASCTVGLVFIS